MALDLDDLVDLPLRLARAIDDRTAAVLRPGVARFAVAYGSNASPTRLMDKDLTRLGALLLPARVRGWIAAFVAAAPATAPSR